MCQNRSQIEAPTLCDNCCSPNIEFTTNAVYFGKAIGVWPYIYYCFDCRAAVGCHANTKNPLGKMADRATRALRVKAHDEFDRLWQSGLMGREQAYNWLASQLEIDVEQCHMAMLLKDQLKDVMTLCADYLSQNYKQLVRRKIKQEFKKNDRKERSDEYEHENAKRFIKKRESNRNARKTRRAKNGGIAHF